MVETPVVNGNGNGKNTVNHISSTSAMTVGELKNILRNFSDDCPVTTLRFQYIYPKEGEGLLQVISQS